MSQTKAQLIQPIGVVTASGVVVSGVMTAATFDGDVVGSATSVIQGKNLNLGAFNATSFAGDFTGNATGIITSSAIKVGQLTASSFVGDFTGTATSMMRGTGFEAGAVTGTSFVADVTGNVTGNATGLAGSVTQGTNIHVGIVTVTGMSGDGSNLTGIAATNYNTQTVNVATATTTIDLSAGNMITMNQGSSTTVSLANTSEAMDVTLMRVKDNSWNISYSSGGVTFDGSGDYLELAANSDFAFGTGDFTIELWFQVTSNTTHQSFITDWDNFGWQVEVYSDGKCQFAWGPNSTAYWSITGSTVVSTNTWYHLAVVRNGNTFTQYLNGSVDGSFTSSTTAATNGQINIGYNNDNGAARSLNGKISNLRVLKGTALYTDDFVPPRAALTNITNTKLLCCQSTSSTTTAAVTPGTITANGDPTAGAQTISASGTVPTAVGAYTITWPDSIKWDGGSAPTLVDNNPTGEEVNQIRLLTRDQGVTWYGWEDFSNSRTDTTLFAWGFQGFGQFGQNSDTPSFYSSPVQIPGSTWRNGQISDAHVLATKTDNTLWVWGGNQQGALGNNKQYLSVSSPVQVAGSWSFGAAGNFQRSYAIKTSGSLWVWGRNEYGALGLNQSSSGLHGKSSPTQLGTDTNWSKAGDYAYYRSSWGIKTDGTLWTWGSNQNGRGGWAPDNVSRSSPTQLGTGTDWSDMCGTYASAMALKTDGSLWAWGYNAFGQLGQNNATEYSSPRQIPGTWDNIASGSYSNYGVKTDGTLWGWGCGQRGELGLNSNLSPAYQGRSSPVQIPGTTWARVVSVGNQSVGAVKTDGTFWTWGYNDAGMLGQNEYGPSGQTSKSSPTQIPGTNWDTNASIKPCPASNAGSGGMLTKSE